MKTKRPVERRFIGADKAPVEIRMNDEGRPTELVGYAAVFNQWATIQDWWGGAWLESIAPGAFAKTIAEADIRALFNHDPNIVLGRNRAGTLELYEDAVGLRNRIIPPDNEWGRPVLDAVARGDITGQSIAFRVVKEKWERPEERDEMPKRTILEARLFDVGPVTFPAFEATSIDARALEINDDEHDATLMRAVRLIRLARYGYPIEAEDRSVIESAISTLRKMIHDEPENGATHFHSSEPESPPLRFHSAETRWRLLQLLSKQL